MPLRTLNIRLDFPYRIGFTRGAFHPENGMLASLMEQRKESRILVLMEEGLEQFYPELLPDIDRYFQNHAGNLIYTGCRAVPGGEAAKNTFSAWETILRHMVAAGIDRHSYTVAVGGGAFLDVAGFAAATAHRGIRLLRVPTTTLSQADSGVGVKNGINFMGQKNYLGTFAVPWATLNDFQFLHSQPLFLKRAGLAEVVKVAVVKDAAFFDWLEANAHALAACEQGVLEYAVQHSAMLHAEHIACSGDAFERGSSRPLDFGHWAAHYMETMSGYTLGHAEAVSVGMCLDILYSVRKGWLAAAEAERIFSVLQTLELPVFHPVLSRRSEDGLCEVLKGLEAFREHLGGRLTVLMLTGIGRGKDVHEIDAVLMADCIRDMEEGARCSGEGNTHL